MSSDNKLPLFKHIDLHLKFKKEHGIKPTNGSCVEFEGTDYCLVNEEWMNYKRYYEYTTKEKYSSSGFDWKKMAEDNAKFLSQSWKEIEEEKRQTNKALNISFATENINYCLNNKVDQDNLTSLFKFDYSKEPQEGDEIENLSGDRYRMYRGNWINVNKPIESRDKNEGIHQPLPKLIKPKQTMEKQIKMSLETARQLYNNYEGSLRLLLLENFTKEELEGNKGFTWEDSFDTIGFIIDSDSRIMGTWSLLYNQPTSELRNVFKTKEQAESALAFAQLSHIVPKYNDHPSDPEQNVFYGVGCVDNKVVLAFYSKCEHAPLKFYSKENAQISLEVNRELWEKYHMIQKVTATVIETDIK